MPQKKEKTQELKSQDQHLKGSQGRADWPSRILAHLQGNQGRSDVHLDEVSKFHTYPIIIIYAPEI